MKSTRWEPLTISIKEGKRDSSQWLWAHVDCLGQSLHKSIPFFSLQERTEMYDSWLVDKVQALEVGQLIDGTITRVKDYGLFVHIGDGFHALLHISDISQEDIQHPSQIFSEGDSVRAVIISIDRPKKRISLSTSVLEPEPGDMLRDRQKVYEKAEEIAEKFRGDLL